MAFFGLPLAALGLHRLGCTITFACLSRQGQPGERRLRRILGADRVFERDKLSDEELQQMIRSTATELLVSWFWVKRLSSAVIQTAELGGLGCHPSLLPRHRGPDPTYWAILLGDEATGVSLHGLTEGYDEGPIYAQRSVAISSSWNAFRLAHALDLLSLEVLMDGVKTLQSGHPLQGHLQNDSLATMAPMPTDEDCIIRWTSPTAEVLRQIRALGPLPGAWTTIGEDHVCVLRAREAEAFPRILEPGEAVVLADRSLVRTGTTAVELLRVEVARDDRSFTLDGPDIAALFTSPDSREQERRQDRSRK